MFEGLDLNQRIRVFNKNYEAVTGRLVSNFHCPILGVDEKTELIRAHIVPENQAVSNMWIPQRGDVDAFYGSIAEADFDVASRIISGDVSAEDLLLRKERRGPRMSVSLGGTELPYYFPPNTDNVPDNFTVGKLVYGNEEKDIAFKIDESVLFGQELREFEMHVNHDSTPEMTATVLKSAHLTMFALMGYDWLFTSAGQMLSMILKKPFLDCPDRSGKQLRRWLEEYFEKFVSMLRPIKWNGQVNFKGTIFDRRCFACMGSSGRVWAIAVHVPMRSDLFSVFLPTAQDPMLETYNSFLREPPFEISVRLLEAPKRDGSELSTFTWQMSPVADRIPLSPLGSA